MTIDRAEYDRIVDQAEAEFLEIWQEGPQVTRWNVLPVQPGDSAPPFVLPDQTGNDVVLGELIAEGPVLLIFWRHFGCGCGFDRVARLHSELDDYRATGANVVVVGQGLPLQAAVYAEEHKLDLLILTDPDRSVYRAYGLLDASQPQVLFDAPQWFWSYSEETAQRFVEARRETGRRLVNNPWLLPGEFVIGQDGIINHAHRYQHCEDFPDPRVLITAITGSALEPSA
jgi:peroxiredoxin